MKPLADLHIHTISSGHGYSTFLEITQAASSKGLELIALTDHGPSMPGAPHLYHFGNLRVIPEEVLGVRILKGVEANIINYEAHLDVPDTYLERLDIVLAGLHTYCYPGGSIVQNTETLIRAMQNPYIDVIVHPGNPEFQADVGAIVEASAALGVAIEINNSSFLGSRKGSVANCTSITELVAEHGSLISVGSDAHTAFDVGNFDEAIKVCLAAGVKEDQIISMSKESVLNYLDKRHKNRKQP